MTRKSPQDMPEAIDRQVDTLLESGLLSVPDDFAERVMREVWASSLPVRRPRWQERLQWLALLGSAVLGALQLTTFIFGIWAATAAS